MRFITRQHCQPVKPVTVMDFSQIEEGFRLLQSGKQMGKIVFKANDNDTILVSQAKATQLSLQDAD